MRKILIILLILPFLFTNAQNLAEVKTHIKELGDEKYSGRGYVDNGDFLAARYISDYFKELGLKNFDDSYFQYLRFPINSFPGKMEFSLNDTLLKPVSEYVIWPASPSIEGTFEYTIVPSSKLSSSDKLIKFGKKKKNKDKVLVIESTDLEKGVFPFLYQQVNLSELNNPALIIKSDKALSWHVSMASRQLPKPVILVNPETELGNSGNINLSVEAKLLRRHKTQNVIGFIEGKTQADSFIVFSAHYDHLGQMGKDTWFPGANDNASGVAMIMDLAKYYNQTENQPDYSLVFIAFAGEEAGLYGSKYYTENPVFPLEKIKMLVNLDMVGTGSTGITVVNGGVYSKEFDLLSEINIEHKLLEGVKKRGEAANSDHYFFHKNGVPSFFIYTTGKEYLKYHVTDDSIDGLPLTDYIDLFKLLTLFVQEL